jgi:hypothetical protein
VAGEEDTDPRAAGGIEDLDHAGSDLRAVGDLTDDPDLHVVNDQGHALRIADVLEAVGDVKLAVLLHVAPFEPALTGYG